MCAQVCTGVHRCAQVCTGVCKYIYMYVGGCGCAYMYMGVCRCEWVCACVCGCVGYAQVCMGVCGSLRKCTSVCKCVCWMNFQNIFWRLESIHQRTLIHILYEFFCYEFYFRQRRPGADDQLYKTKKSFLKFEVKIQGGFTCSSKSFQRNCEDKCYSELKKE